MLRARLATAFKQYRDAKQMAEKYRDVVLPKAQETFDLYQKSFQQMAAAYPQVLMAKRSIHQFRAEYTHSLARLWQSVVEIQGFLLTDAWGAGTLGESHETVPGESRNPE